ncbi:MAG: hypothetical protein LC747_09000 [Acidobacteria bacterium]|nr:hypothetical protein [Acidobacteriota bacterium]
MLLLALACAASLSSTADAQDLVLPPQPAPPPMVYIPEDARTQLLSAHDTKARTRLSLELAEARLVRAEEQTNLKQFNAATAELGIYQALFEDALEHLHRTSDGGSRARDLFKRLELTLNKHAARIEAIRRTTPSEFSGNLRALLKLVRELRTEALEAFYSDTILSENRNDATNSFKPERKDALKIATPQSPLPAKLNEETTSTFS